MKKVLLSHDGKMKMYLVPDEVADNLKNIIWILALIGS